MRTVLVIGMGSGDPEHLTMQAVRALNRADVFFVMDKREETSDLVRLRREICERHIQGHPYRFVEVDDPGRERIPADAPGYLASVEAWHAARAAAWEAAIRDEVPEDGVAAFLAWGDPSLYDSTISVLERVRVRGDVDFTVEVIPGISSVQALTARHGITLNRVGGAIQITTGRRLLEGWPAGVDDVVVMLDGAAAFTRVTEPGVTIYWGAYLGTPDEVLVAGPLTEVADEIVRTRAEARARKGWIMDVYLLRRRLRVEGE